MDKTTTEDVIDALRCSAVRVGEVVFAGGQLEQLQALTEAARVLVQAEGRRSLSGFTTGELVGELFRRSLAGDDLCGWPAREAS